jgi:hypothetical protein
MLYFRFPMEMCPQVFSIVGNNGLLFPKILLACSRMAIRAPLSYENRNDRVVINIKDSLLYYANSARRQYSYEVVRVSSTEV